ncbi:VOC family protein [Streptomyces sp. NEAU-YJ-81]|uniref:VOC family protein n=1 Tax=Streptomyces sp. NEAU-YJ-81 TaxID=2820288 RepID=UPI001ABD261B|nr:VOC family protein [Streptomyces sp. NEAU-YJ-81]MBO3682275.1 VOC family protein [Streptomyces sp. NEAU-YJ-81]
MTSHPYQPITHLRHVDLAVPDFAVQRAFYRDTWGLTEVANDSGIAFFAAEGSPEQYVVRIREDARKRMDLVAFGAASRADVDELAGRLLAAGVRPIADPADMDTPGGGYGFRFFDPDGRVVEVSAEVENRVHRKIEAREAIPVRLSHCVVNSENPERLRAFYEQHLGFRLSDTLFSHRMGDLMYFMRCNPHHHSFAIARGPHVSLHHASFEMRGLEEYMRGTGRALRAGTRLTWGPGRHLAGDNTFAYFHDPHGNTVEYTTELAVLEEDLWHPGRHDVDDPLTQDQWGTADPMSESIAKEQFNDPDVLFTAPPV